MKAQAPRGQLVAKWTGVISGALAERSHVPLGSAVVFTDATNRRTQTAEVDATAARLSGGEMQSVIQTDATKYRRSERANSVPKYGPFFGVPKIV